VEKPITWKAGDCFITDRGYGILKLRIVKFEDGFRAITAAGSMVSIAPHKSASDLIRSRFPNARKVSLNKII